MYDYAFRYRVVLQHASLSELSALGTFQEACMLRITQGPSMNLAGANGRPEVASTNQWPWPLAPAAGCARDVGTS
jgi:hypothetical protein